MSAPSQGVELKPSARLEDDAVSGLRWTLSAQVGRQIIQLVTVAVLARLVAPASFGLLAMALVVIGFADLFRDLGTSSAIIQRQEVDARLLSSVFWIGIVSGALISGCLYAAAPYFAAMYSEPQVTPVLRALSLALFISQLGGVQNALLERSLHFQALATIEFAATITSAIAGITTALMGYGVWSLVAQNLAAATTSTVLLWSRGRWRPQWVFDWSSARSIRSYSLYLIGFALFNYATRNADYFLIGRYLGARDLGFYTLAYRLMLQPLATVSSVVTRVMFPLFARIQNDDARFRRMYLEMCSGIGLVTFPMMLGLSAVSALLITVAFGSEWSPVSGLLWVLAPVGAAQSIAATVGLIYQAKGRTRLMFAWGVFSGTLATVSFVVGLNWGVYGVAAAYAIASLVLLPLGTALPIRIIGLSFSDLIASIRGPALAATSMACVVVAVDNFLPDAWLPSLRLVLLIMTGVAVYGALAYIFNRRQLTVIWSRVRHPSQAS